MSNHHHHHQDHHSGDIPVVNGECENTAETEMEPEIMTQDEIDEMDASQKNAEESEEELQETPEDNSGKDEAEDASQKADNNTNVNTDSANSDVEKDNNDEAKDDTCDKNNTCEEAKADTKADAKADEHEWKDAYIRMAADFDNYRKRTSKEQDDIRKRERERVINIWLDVYDNAERALHTLPEKEGPWYEGFSSLVQQMDKCLATLNIRPVDDMGKPFDPKRHEAIATCPNPGMQNNTIMHVDKRGFEYTNGDVARIARVIVVKNPT